MPVWERYSQTQTLTSVGEHGNTLVFANEANVDNFQSADIVVVDGIITIHTNTDDLIGARLLVVPEALVSADLNEDDPEPHHTQVYYSWFVARGPLVFRLRSKKTIPPEHNLWMQLWKAQGANATIVNTGQHILLQLKH